MKNKFKFYTKEQEEKVERLRMEAETEREARKNQRQEKSFDFEVGNPVFITLGGKTISGYVMSRASEGYFSTYEVKTPLGRIKDVAWTNIKRRFVEDLSGVYIPKELKEYSTGNLLHMLQAFRNGSYSYYYHHAGCKFTETEIKAELRLRPHVPSKGEKKVFKKYTN